jgi:formylaminopyrimidine deformylase
LERNHRDRKSAEARRVFRKIDDLESDILSLLSKLVSFNTADPPAANCTEAQGWLSYYMQSKIGGVSDETFEDFPGDPHLVSVLKSKSNNGRSIIFNGHIDVAEVRKDEIWKYGAFTPKLENGLFYGRGAADMKGGLTAMLTSIRAVKECGIELGGDVVFESVAGEEAGEAGTKTCIDRGYKADFAMISEPSNFKIQGQGGVDYWLDHSQESRDLSRRNARVDDTRGWWARGCERDRKDAQNTDRASGA